MKASGLFRSWLRRRRGSDNWQDDLRSELAEQKARGASTREIVEHLARQMYLEDLQDLGAVADLGFFTWQLYLGAAQFVVNSALLEGEDSKLAQQSAERGTGEGRRAA